MTIDSPKRSALDVQAASDLRNQLQQDPKVGMHKAAKEFESLFLNMVLKSMRDTVPQDGLMHSDQTRFYTSMLDQQLAQDLAGKGGLGFAKMIEEQFNRTLATSSPPPTGETPNPDTPAPGLSPAARTLLQQLQQAKPNALGADLPGNTPMPSLPSLPRNLPHTPTTSPAPTPIPGSLGGRGPGALSGGRPGEFVSKLWPHAVEVSRVTGIPPQFMVAQAALETGWGRHEMLNADGSPSYNLFGVKAGRNWPGASVQAETSEFVEGEEVRTLSTFRSYTSYAEAFDDYAQLLRSHPRYGAVIGSQDGTEFARRLQQAGYATDPLYAEKLARIINGPTLRQAITG